MVELWSRIYDNGGHGLSPKSALFYAANVVSALNALHLQNIVYRDLKPENLMIDSRGYLKLIDMGFAKKMEPFHGSIGLDCRSTTICGTPEYLVRTKKTLCEACDCCDIIFTESLLFLGP